ncbi:MAG: iron-containing alcohol dehydrogenase [Marinoscillum sp.]
MKDLIINQPKKLILGENALNQLVDDINAMGLRRVFILTDPFVASNVLPVFGRLHAEVSSVKCSGGEPTFTDFDAIVTQARAHKADCVVGIGGGSVLDLAKLVAALLHSKSQLNDVVGNGLIKKRTIPLICMPTTSGAGSESSPNAILIDDKDNSKKGIIDQVLMPDSVYIDPHLISTLPPEVTAYTGLDALTHCIEAYANKHAHPVVDMYALEGIRLISQNLGTVIANGKDLNARTKVALGSYYGGMCLGPVNTAAVHALAYPLGTTYKIAHGLSNALLLPFVLEYNLSAAPDRYANIALAMGGDYGTSKHDRAMASIQLIRNFIKECGMPSHLSALEISKDSIPQMAADAMLIQRLLRNNVREVQLEDAISIYQSAL